jgi:formate hydrogenlyase subunit 4
MTALMLIAQALLLLALPPLLPGLITKTKAVFAGRRGPPVLQGYYDLRRLVRKDSVTSRTTTWMFVAGPAVTLVAVLFAGLLVPIGPAPAAFAFTGDFVLFAYLLGLARFFTTSAALDTGSAFEGMGAARDVTYACFAELSLFLGLLALGARTHSSSLSGMLAGTDAGDAPAVLVAAGFVVVLLAENSRIPVDDPTTHLELTMIHEVMVLDHSGPALAAILYAAATKLLVFSAILVHLTLPVVTDAAVGWPLYLGALGLVAVAIGCVESLMARLRLTFVPALLVGAALFSGFGFLLAVT